MIGSKARTIIAVLLNPPTGNGSRTHAHLRVAADCLACDVVRVVNLFPVATKDLAALSEVGHDPDTWIAQRPVITEAIKNGDEVLLGWGVSSPTGPARVRLDEQIRWVMAELEVIGVEAWVVGDGPRHPSRWHQYVSDRYNRTDGGAFVDRIRESLVLYRDPRSSLTAAQAH